VSNLTKRYFTENFTGVSAFSGKHYLYLFLLWPFVALITAISNFNRKESRIVIYLYLVYYGLNYVLGTTGYVDAVGYSMKLAANAALPFSDFFRIVGGLYSNDTSMDIIEPLISFVVSRFTSDHRILFAVYAALFGYFYLKSITFAYSFHRQNPGWDSLIHLIFFILILPVTSINGFRMWTAAWIFLFGAYNVIIYRDPRYFIITACSALVHWSFLSANVLLAIYFFAGNRNMIYLPLAAASFILPGLITPVFQRISLMMGGGVLGRFDMYTDESYGYEVQALFQEASWFLKIGYDLVLFYLLIASLILHYSFSSLINSRAEKNMFSFLLLFLSFVNFGNAIPSFGERFQILFFLFGTLYLIICYSRLPWKNLSYLTLAGLFPMILYSAIIFRQGADSINAWLFTPLFGLPLFMPALSIGDLLFH